VSRAPESSRHGLRSRRGREAGLSRPLPPRGSGRGHARATRHLREVRGRAPARVSQVRVPPAGDLRHPRHRRREEPRLLRGVPRAARALRPQWLRHTRRHERGGRAALEARVRGDLHPERRCAHARRRGAGDRRVPPRHRREVPDHPRPHAVPEGDGRAPGAVLRAARLRLRDPGRARSFLVSRRLGSFRPRSRRRPRRGRVARRPGVVERQGGNDRRVLSGLGSVLGGEPEAPASRHHHS